MQKINHNQLSAFVNVNREFYYKLAFSYVHNDHEALLMIRVSISKAFETIRKLYNPLALKAWFYQIIVDTSIAYLNDKQRFIMIKTDDGIVIPEELELLVKQTVEEAENKVVMKKRIFICILSVIVALMIIAYLYLFIKSCL